MTRRIYWGVALLSVMIVGFVAFQIYLHNENDKYDFNPAYIIPPDLYNKNGKLDYSNPNFSIWMDKYSKSVDNMMELSKLSDETGGKTSEEFMDNIKNLTDKEKKKLADLIIKRSKDYQNTLNEYVNISSDKPVKEGVLICLRK